MRVRITIIHALYSMSKLCDAFSIVHIIEKLAELTLLEADRSAPHVIWVGIWNLKCGKSRTLLEIHDWGRLSGGRASCSVRHLQLLLLGVYVRRFCMVLLWGHDEGR